MDYTQQWFTAICIVVSSEKDYVTRITYQSTRCQRYCVGYENEKYDETPWADAWTDARSQRQNASSHTINIPSRSSAMILCYRMYTGAKFLQFNLTIELGERHTKICRVAMIVLIRTVSLWKRSSLPGYQKNGAFRRQRAELTSNSLKLFANSPRSASLLSHQTISEYWRGRVQTHAL